MRANRILVLSFFFITITLVAYGQAQMSAEDFFRNALTSGLQKKIIPGPDAPRMPWLEELELRTETRDFLWREQEYTLRISPNSPLKKKAQQELLSAIRAQKDYLTNDYLCELSEQAHEQWLKLYMIDAEQEVLEELLGLLKEEQSMLELQLQNLKINESLVIDSYYKINDLEYQLFQLEEAQRYVKSESGMIDTISLSFEGIISIQDIMQRVDESALNGNAINDQKLEAEISITEKELALEEAERRKYFDFAQVKYRGPHDDFWNERMSIGLGLKMNRSGGDRIKKYELETKLNQLNTEREDDNYSKAEAIRKVEQELRLKVRNHEYVKQQNDLEIQKTEAIKKNLLSSETLDANLWLKIKLREQKMKIRLHESKVDIYLRYLKWLDENDAYCVDPYNIFLK